MKTLLNKLGEWTPIVWGLLWTMTITIGSVALLITVCKWLLSVMGVM